MKFCLILLFYSFLLSQNSDKTEIYKLLFNMTFDELKEDEGNIDLENYNFILNEDTTIDLWNFYPDLRTHKEVVDLKLFESIIEKNYQNSILKTKEQIEKIIKRRKFIDFKLSDTTFFTFKSNKYALIYIELYVVSEDGQGGEGVQYTLKKENSKWNIYKRQSIVALD